MAARAEAGGQPIPLPAQRRVLPQGRDAAPRLGAAAPSRSLPNIMAILVRRRKVAVRGATDTFFLKCLFVDFLRSDFLFIKFTLNLIFSNRQKRHKMRGKN